MQRDRKNKSKVISHFSEIISSTKKEYQTAVIKIKKRTEENNELKGKLEKYKYYYSNDIKNQKDGMRKRKLEKKREILERENENKKSIKK